MPLLIGSCKDEMLIHFVSCTKVITGCCNTIQDRTEASQFWYRVLVMFTCIQIRVLIIFPVFPFLVLECNMEITVHVMVCQDMKKLHLHSRLHWLRCVTRTEI